MQAFPHGVTPEVDLLLQCGLASIDSKRTARVRALVREDTIDWSDLVEKALYHRLMPLLYWHLSAICPEATPPVVLERLRTHFGKNA